MTPSSSQALKEANHSVYIATWDSSLHVVPLCPTCGSKQCGWSEAWKQLLQLIIDSLESVTAVVATVFNTSTDDQQPVT